MRKLKVLAMALIFTLAMGTACSFACSAVYVGKDVSTDGTTILARSEDQGDGGYNKMFRVVPRETKAGRYMVDTGEDENGFKVPLPKTTYKYTEVVDNSFEGDGPYPGICTNEYGMSISGTVSASPSEAYEKVDPFVEYGLREAILPALIACQTKTAKEAVLKIAELVDKYGSKEGNILYMADKKEAWIIEIYGGHQYAAMKMPTDKVAVFGNQYMIDVVDQNDTENYIFSKDLFTTIDKVGNVVKEDGKYNLVKSISGPREEYSNMRTWIGHKILAPSTIGEYNNDEFYPLFYSPDKKVSPLTVMDIYRNRYEGTKFDMNLPENAERRPIATTRQSQIHVVQIMPNMPREMSAVQWLALGNAEHSVFIPTFSGITDTHSAYKVDGNSYDPSGAYWQFKRVCGVAETDRAHLGASTKDYWKLEEQMMYKQMQKEIKKVADLYKKSPKKARTYVTKLGKDMTQNQLNNSEKLFNGVFTTLIENINDRNGKRMQTFAADTRLTKGANYYGYSVKKSGKSYTLTKGSTKYVLTLGSDVCKATVDGKTNDIELSKAPYVDGKYAYAPLDFIRSL
ncbi:MAG: C69 family dipeptidase [Eubacteriales bacterium]|nr:C69 family dipeptidase [Eubacteriales bacterium]